MSETWQTLLNRTLISIIPPLTPAEVWGFACWITKRSYPQLWAHQTTLLVEPHQAEQFQHLCQQRQTGVPFAYLTHEREFFSRSFYVDERVLIPRPDTELLIEITLKRLHEIKSQKHLSVLDLGTGSGIIPITLLLEWAHLQQSNLHIWGADVSTDALAVATINTHRLLTPSQQLKIQWVASDWFSNLNPSIHRFNLICSNPPYIAQTDPHLTKEDLRFEPKQALTDHADGLTHITHIIQQASHFLKPEGRLILEHGYNQAFNVSALFQKMGWIDIKTHEDLGHQPRCTEAKIPHHPSR